MSNLDNFVSPWAYWITQSTVKELNLVLPRDDQIRTLTGEEPNELFSTTDQEE